MKAQTLKKSTLVENAGIGTSSYPCPECSKTNARYHVLAGKYGPTDELLLLPITFAFVIFHGRAVLSSHR